jgi:signal transduction histidine kinase
VTGAQVSLMDIQTINNLLDASAQGDSPKARLESLLRGISEAFFDKSASISITKKIETGEEQLLVSLVDGKATFFEDEAAAAEDGAYKIELAPSQRATHLYLTFPTRPEVSEDLLQTVSKLVSKGFIDLAQERRETLVYGLLNSFREDIFHPAEPIGRPAMIKVARDIASAFCNPNVWTVLYDFRSWRHPRTKPLIISHAGNLAGMSADYFNDRINTEIGKLLQELKETEPIGRTVVIPPDGKDLNDLRVYIACASLVSCPREPDPVAGIPFVAVVLKEDEDVTVDAEQRRLLKKFVLELQRVLRLREGSSHMQGLAGLLQTFLSLSTPAEIANAAIDLLAETFNTTEIAVLERRGMFLSFIGQKGVPLKTMPPLHIHNTPARVTMVARTRKELYDKNVRHEKNSYLEVVQATKTQFTVPLIWRNDLVGVLILGLAVIDGLEARDQRFIRALAGYCAAAIAGSQRTSDERAVTHMLREVLTGAALKLRQVIESGKVERSQRDELQVPYDLLEHCQVFIEKFRQAQAAGHNQGRIDLRSAAVNYRAEPLVNSILKNHPGCSIEVDVGPEALIANANYEGILLALNNLVVNALESMEGSPGTVRVSVRKERVRYKSNTRYVYYGVISVADEGKGISPQEQSKIFDLFYTTKPNHLGTGLRIAQNIIEQFGGRVEVQSPPSPESEAGSEFSLWIPIVQRGSVDG